MKGTAASDSGLDRLARRPASRTGRTEIITAEKRVEALLGETLTNTARERSLAEQLWKLLMSFNGFEGFSDATEQVSAEETQHTAEFEHEGVSYDPVATPVTTEQVVDPVLVATSSPPATQRVTTLSSDVAAALACKRALADRELTEHDDQFTAFQVTVPNGLHPLSRFIKTAEVTVDSLPFSVTRTDEETTWLPLRAARDVCNTLTTAAEAAESGDFVSATEVANDQCRCQSGVDTADIHHRLAVEDVSIVDVSADVRATEFSLRLPPQVDVARVIGIFQARWPATRLRSRPVLDSSSVHMRPQPARWRPHWARAGPR